MSPGRSGLPWPCRSISGHGSPLGSGRAWPSGGRRSCTRSIQMPDVPPAAAFRKSRHGGRGQAEGLVQLTEGEQAGIGGDPGVVELELQAVFEGDPRGSLASPVASATLHPSRHFHISDLQNQRKISAGGHRLWGMRDQMDALGE